ncbi:hypothetical protein N5P32_01290 [Marinomonas pontica]|uniref:hypothetical protein n=1 Tax=Marinomonas pontica TaxID=264739 RepID=UPI002244926D|nr:hypothetical protein [Marinomonas pontica]MCW8354619.1 hypothetical protein [Marinomonas pontica]
MNKLPLILGMVFFSTTVLAESRGYDLELGPSLSYIDYNEYNDVSQSGTVSGFRARYSAYYPFSVSLLDVAYVNSDIDYKGEGKISSVRNEIYDVRGMIGRAFFLNGAYRVTPYLGLGYRRSTMDSRGKTSSTSVAGYKSQQSYVYNPIGIEIQELMSDQSTWAVGGRFEYDGILSARNETRLGAADGYRSVTLSQRNGRGYHISLRFQHFLNENGSGIVIEPFYKYWSVSGNNSRSVSSRVGNHSSNQWGASLLLSF